MPSSSSSDSDTDSSTGSSTSSSASSKDVPIRKMVPAKAQSAPQLPSTGDKTLDRFRASEVGRKVNNPTLEYAKPDTEIIMLPTNATGSNGIDLVRVISDLCAFRAKAPKLYRAVDYFVASTRLFLDEVTEEYAQQAARKRRENKSYDRFLWANTGQLAIHYALACDCVKQLCDKIQFTPSSYKPSFDFFMASYIDFLIQASRIPEAILQAKTYDVKLKDWKKGGTRYQATESRGSEVVTNVRFPAARQRREKLESYLRDSETIVEIESSKVAVEATGKVVAVTAVHSKSNAEAKVAEQPGVLSAGLVPVKTANGSVIYVPAPKGFVPESAASAPGRVAMKSAMRPTLPNHNPWRQSIFRLLGGTTVLYYPVECVGLMGSFVTIAERAPEKADKQYILRLLIESAVRSKSVLEAFDKCGGIKLMKAWMLAATQKNDLYILHSLIEFTANRFDCYCSDTREDWRAELPPEITKPSESSEYETDNAPAEKDEPKAIRLIEFLRSYLATLPVALSKDNSKLIENVTGHLKKIEHKMQSVEWAAGWGLAKSDEGTPAVGSALRPIGLSTPSRSPSTERRQPDEASPEAMRALRQQQLIQMLQVHWGSASRTTDAPLLTGPLPRLAGSMGLPAELQAIQKHYINLGGVTMTGPEVLRQKTATEAAVGPTELAAMEVTLGKYLAERQYSLYERLTHLEGFDFGDSGIGSEGNGPSLQAVLGQKRQRDDSEGSDEAHDAPPFSWFSMPVWYNPYDMLAAATAWAPASE